MVCSPYFIMIFFCFNVLSVGFLNSQCFKISCRVSSIVHKQIFANLYTFVKISNVSKSKNKLKESHVLFFTLNSPVYIFLFSLLYQTYCDSMLLIILVQHILDRPFEKFQSPCLVITLLTESLVAITAMCDIQRKSYLKIWLCLRIQSERQFHNVLIVVEQMIYDIKLENFGSLLMQFKNNF